MAQTAKIKVVDIFAGPGGLGEGFSSFKTGNNSPFQIVLSAEKNRIAHKTLTLRAFFRRYKSAKDVPEEYYQIVRGEITPEDLDGEHANQWKEAERSEEHTSELQSLMRISYAVFCLKKKTQIKQRNET